MAPNFLKNLYVKLNGTALDSGEALSVDEQRAFLASLPEPKDDYERSFLKYKCFCAYNYTGRKWMLPIYNFGAMLIYPFLYTGYKIKGRSRKTPIKQCDSVVENVPRLRNYDVIPKELQDNLGETYEIEEINYKTGCLTGAGIEICKELRKRYFWNFYFRTIVTIKLALFNGYLADYNPKRIVYYSCEKEFSGPLQTLLCEKNGAEYVVFMHGDYLYMLCLAFQKYSHYYIWDEAYDRMFKELRCQFPTTIYQPEKLSSIAKNIDEHDCEYFATYYFSAETRACAEKIAAVFREFEAKGLRCKIRAHPRFSNLPMLKEVFEGITIEDTYNYSLADSITASLYSIGLNTTVLSQAYFSGKKVAIDDISAPEQYRDLRNREYIMMNRPHALLSEVISQVNSDNPYDASYKFFM